MRRPRVAAVVSADRRWGGSFQYSRQVIRSLRAAGAPFEVSVIGFQEDENRAPETPAGLTAAGRWTGRIWERLPSSWRSTVNRIRFRLPPSFVAPLRWSFRRRIDELGADLVVFCEPNTLGFESGLPYLMPIHDLLHRAFPEFPETFANGARESREYCYRNAARTARCLFVDSETSREDVVRYYGIPGGRVRVLPFVPSIRTAPATPEEIRAIRAKYRLPDRYFFYPAQFWKHKNHVRLVRAVDRLRALPDIALVLCGSRQNGTAEFEREVTRLRLADRVRNLGYVPDEDLPGLYGGSVGLVMPTFNGPINIPIVEAFALGVPVIASDIRGIREHVGDAALPADPRDEASLAEAMRRMWTDESLRRDLAARGRLRIGPHREEEFTRTLVEAVSACLG